MPGGMPGDGSRDPDWVWLSAIPRSASQQLARVLNGGICMGRYRGEAGAAAGADVGEEVGMGLPQGRAHMAFMFFVDVGRSRAGVNHPRLYLTVSK